MGREKQRLSVHAVQMWNWFLLCLWDVVFERSLQEEGSLGAIDLDKGTAQENAQHIYNCTSGHHSVASKVGHSSGFSDSLHIAALFDSPVHVHSSNGGTGNTMYASELLWDGWKEKWGLKMLLEDSDTNLVSCPLLPIGNSIHHSGSVVPLL